MIKTMKPRDSHEKHTCISNSIDEVSRAVSKEVSLIFTLWTARLVSLSPVL